MKIKNFLYLLSFFLLTHQGFALNYFNQEEFDKAIKAGPIGIAKISIVTDQNTTTGSAMIYKYEDKIIGITAAHTLDRAIEKDPNDINFSVAFNLSGNGSQVVIPTSLVKIHPNHKPFLTIFDERDPEKVKNDLAIFTIPYFSDIWVSKLFDLKIESILSQAGEYKTTAYSYGPSHTTNLEKFYTPVRNPQMVNTTICYDDKSGLFKQNYTSNQLLLTIDKVTHKIDFSILINESSKVTSLPGDSGANLIDQDTKSVIAMFTHHDYIEFFQKNSLLAQFYTENVMLRASSQARTDNFLKNLVEHGEILEDKDIGNERYIAFQSKEMIDCSTLFTPIHQHHHFIMQFIKEIPATVLENDSTFFQRFFKN